MGRDGAAPGPFAGLLLILAYAALVRHAFPLIHLEPDPLATLLLALSLERCVAAAERSHGGAGSPGGARNTFVRYIGWGVIHGALGWVVMTVFPATLLPGVPRDGVGLAGLSIYAAILLGPHVAIGGFRAALTA